ncbi:MAG TPA: kelch repeat-containing protein, partial [Candidatus Limnocylindrales bacterium]|nr:kelch repeat-containing protein [Candidatus Limnocylindrales bacterium]
MSDFDQFERRLSAALRADAELSVAGFDASAIARGAVAAGRRHPLRERLVHLLARRPLTLGISPAWLVVLLVLALIAGAIAAGVLRSDQSNPVTERPTGLAPSNPASSASPSTTTSPAAVEPRPASWTATGSMGTPRSGHSATLLADGRVLVAGGHDGAAPLASAELYDPSSGTWTATGSMVAHVGGDFTATLLRDGRVLVAGGGESGNLYRPTAAAELYDPATGSWTATGSMTAPRSAHLAVLLPDGRVLVA